MNIRIVFIVVGLVVDAGLAFLDWRPAIIAGVFLLVLLIIQFAENSPAAGDPEVDEVALKDPDPQREDLAERFKVWKAMSNFYLDTELTERDITWIASVCAKSPYTVKELDQIMFSEVWPAVASNLASFAGEWAGFNDDWLKRTILRKTRPNHLLPWWINPLKALFWTRKWSHVRSRVREARELEAA